jgi:hypothetical protein
VAREAAALPSPAMNCRRRICHPLKLTLDSLSRSGLHWNGSIPPRPLAAPLMRPRSDRAGIKPPHLKAAWVRLARPVLGLFRLGLRRLRRTDDHRDGADLLGCPVAEVRRQHQGRAGGVEVGVSVMRPILAHRSWRSDASVPRPNHREGNAGGKLFTPSLGQGLTSLGRQSARSWERGRHGRFR